jgi:hypothetical protein
MNLSGKTYWKQKTNRGRVVYDRKKHRFKIKRVVDIVISIINSEDKVLYSQVLAINALKEVVDLGLYPYYLSVIGKDLSLRSFTFGEGERRMQEPDFDFCTAFYKDQFINDSKTLVKQLGEKFGVPADFSGPILDKFYGPLWSWADATLGEAVRRMFH